MHEVPLFSGAGVQVTSARVVSGMQTYPTASIASVSSFTVPADRGASIIGAVFFAVLIVVGGGLTACGQAVDVPTVAGLGVVLALLGAVSAAALAVLAVTKKPGYGVQITIAGGGTVQVMRSPNQALVGQVIGAVNQALTMR